MNSYWRYWQSTFCDFFISFLSFIYICFTRFFEVDSEVNDVTLLDSAAMYNSLSEKLTKKVLITQNGLGGNNSEEISQLLNGRKLILLSGSFNPLHEGHIFIKTQFFITI